MNKFTQIMIITTLAFGVALSANAANTVRGFDDLGPKDEIAQGPGGFSDVIYKNIKEIKDKAKDKETVIVRGKLVKYFGGEDYEFQDLDNKTIVVKLSNKRNWSYIAKDEPIEIVALYMKKIGKDELIVKKARPLSPKDGFIDGYRHGRHQRHFEDCPYYHYDCPYYR